MVWLLQRHGEWRGKNKSNPPQKSHGSSVFCLYLENISWTHQAVFIVCLFCGFDACAATNPCSLWQHLAPSHAEGGSAQGFHPTACILGSNPSRPPISDGNSLNPTGSCSWESCLGKDTPSSNCSLNYFQLGLRERLCEAKSHQTPGSPRCYGGVGLLWAPPRRKLGPTARESPPGLPILLLSLRVVTFILPLSMHPSLYLQPLLLSLQPQLSPQFS